VVGLPIDEIEPALDIVDVIGPLRVRRGPRGMEQRIQRDGPDRHTMPPPIKAEATLALVPIARQTLLNWSLTFAERGSRYFESRAIKKAWTMFETRIWDKLTRPEQRLLIKLFGGGTTRNEHPAVVDGLRSRGLVDENDKLAMAGLLVFTLAIRKQQAEAQLRAGCAA
jgi:hypothetical protein